MNVYIININCDTKFSTEDLGLENIPNKFYMKVVNEEKFFLAVIKYEIVWVDASLVEQGEKIITSISLISNPPKPLKTLYDIVINDRYEVYWSK